MDDVSLIARLVAGDQAAVGEIYDRYGRHVFALARRVLADSSAAEDVTQEVFVKVWRNASRFDPGRGRVGTWILHIAYTTAADQIRMRHRGAPSRFEELPDEPDTSVDPAADAEIAVMGAQVRVALLRLPPEQRQVLEMAYFGAMTQQEITTRLGIPLGTVKSRVRLGLESLRQHLMAPLRKEADSNARLFPHR